MSFGTAALSLAAAALSLWLLVLPVAEHWLCHGWTSAANFAAHWALILTWVEPAMSKRRVMEQAFFFAVLAPALMASFVLGPALVAVLVFHLPPGVMALSDMIANAAVFSHYSAVAAMMAYAAMVTWRLIEAVLNREIKDCVPFALPSLNFGLGFSRESAGLALEMTGLSVAALDCLLLLKLGRELLRSPAKQ